MSDENRSKAGRRETADKRLISSASSAVGIGAPGQRVGMISLGCPKNLVDSEIMLGTLRNQGFEIVQDVGEADTVIVNTCGFIDEAKQESIDTLLEIAALKNQTQESGGSTRGPERLVVAGCMASRYAQELAAEIPEIDAFVTLDQLQEVATPLVRLGRSIEPLTAPAAEASHKVFDHTAPRLLTTRGYAYLKVAEGCNNPCTFCAIPVWRGRFRSRTIESLVLEARKLERDGVRELVLLAQDTTRYGEDLELGRHGLRRLVEALLDQTSVPWIRFLYAYPTTLDPELLALMGQEERFVSYVDMPLQHSHPEILTAMRRGGSAERYLRLLASIREKAPDAFLRSTFIVGFPGETEEHFENLLDFVAEARFDHMGAFVFSREDDTPSAVLPNQVERPVAEERRDRLMSLQQQIALESRQRLVGRVLPMLVEGVCDETEHLLQARHAGMAPEIDGRVLINDGTAPTGTIVDVEVTEAFVDDLVGHIVGARGNPGVATSGLELSS